LSANRNKARPASGSSRQVRQRHIPIASLPERSQAARDRGFHVLAAMRRDPDLTPTQAAKLEGVSYRTLKKYFDSELEKVANRYRVTPSDRRVAYVFLPDESGTFCGVKPHPQKIVSGLAHFSRISIAIYAGTVRRSRNGEM
jgi:hypothetical protein